MLLVFGSINLDIAFTASHLPRAGETVLGGGYQVSPGGKGANQAHAARLDGAEVCLVGAVGHDAFADAALLRLQAAGVDLSHVQRLDAPTGAAAIVVDAQAENQIVVAPGANLLLRSDHVTGDLLARAGAVLLQGETDAGQNRLLLARARQRECLAILNNAPAAALAGDVLRLLDVLVVNESELAASARTAGVAAPDAQGVLRALSERFGVAVVLTRGAQGALACLDARMLHVPAFHADVIDTTGAGDTFTGVLAASLMAAKGEWKSAWAQALRRACAAAALACLRAGAQVAQPARGEIDALLASAVT